jgi:tRNA(fMet)-specific endonuclease VapC
VILLDTDHVVVLKYPEDPCHASLSIRMSASPDQDFATTVVTIEEQMRGWLALIHGAKDVHKQVPAYARLKELFEFFSRWNVEGFDHQAADEFDRLRGRKVRIGTMDLKIAAIALVHDAVLLSANLRDFGQVPGLRVEDWLRQS